MGGSGFSLGPMAGKLLADQIDLDFNDKDRRRILPAIKKLDPKVEMPVYKSSGASGMDLMAFIKSSITIKPKTSCFSSSLNFAASFFPSIKII